MRKVRFYVPLKNLKNDILKIDGQEFKHLHKVLRLGVGADVVAICNDQNIRECKIVELNKDFALAKVFKTTKQKSDGLNLTVFQALIKSDPLSTSVQKCTELGVFEYVPFKSEFGVVEDKGQIVSRLQRVCESSCKQCQRYSAMTINNTCSFDDMCKRLKQYDAVLVAYEKESKNAKEVISKLKKDDKIAVVIGSEGGFSESEISKLALLDNTKFLSLGKLILRADTAVVALVSAIKYELGDFEDENSNVDLGV